MPAASMVSASVSGMFPPTAEIRASSIRTSPLSNSPISGSIERIVAPRMRVFVMRRFPLRGIHPVRRAFSWTVILRVFGFRAMYQTAFME